MISLCGDLFPPLYNIMVSFDFERTVTMPIDPFEYHSPRLLLRLLLFLLVVGCGSVGSINFYYWLLFVGVGLTGKTAKPVSLRLVSPVKPDFCRKWIQTMILYVIRGLIRIGLRTWRAYQAAHMHTNSRKTEGTCISIPYPTR